MIPYHSEHQVRLDGRIPKVACFTRYIPNYRHGVFELLSSRNDMEFTFASSEQPLDETIYCPRDRPFRFRPISYSHFYLPNKKNIVSFSHNVLGAIAKKEFDVLMLSNDILEVDVWISAFLKRLFGFRLVLWGQGISRPETRLRIMLRKCLMGLADACLFYGDDARDTWIARGLDSKKLFVAYNALDTDVQFRMRTTISRKDLDSFRESAGLMNKKIVLFSGRLVMVKRPDVVIRVMERLVKTMPDAHLVIIGDGPDRPMITDLIEKSGLGRHCTLVGAIYDEEILARYFMISRAAIMPAFAGLAIQHAFAYGVPVILGDVKENHNPEAKLVVEGETGLFCADGDVDAFAAATKRLLIDDSLHQKLSRNALAVIKNKHNKQSMADGIVDAVRFAQRTQAD